MSADFTVENPTTITKDFTILPKRTGKGRFIGTVLGIRFEDKNWWGEGEIKIFMDGDTVWALMRAATNIAVRIIRWPRNEKK